MERAALTMHLWRAWLTPSAAGTLQLTLQVVLAVALFTVLQIQGFRHNVRFDLTPTKAFVLSDQAKRVAESLDKPVRVTAFYNSQESGRRREFVDLLDQFRSHSSHFTYRLLDLDRSPGLAKKYGVSSYNTGVLESAERALALRALDEQEITGAILKISRRQHRAVCFVTGHGERSPRNTSEREGYSEVAKALERENFNIRTLGTIPAGGLPEECTVVVLAGPSHDLMPGELSTLVHQLKAGGRALFLVDPDAPQSVLRFLESLGVVAGRDLIVDEQNRFIGWDSFVPRVPMFSPEIFGTSLTAEAVFSLARTIRPRDEPVQDERVIPIAMTSADSWAFVDGAVAPDEEVRFRKGIDRPGPLPVGVMATFAEQGAEDEQDGSGGSEGRLVVFGDSDFATNFYLNLLGNKDLFMSTVAFLAEDPELIAVRQKGTPRGSISPISLTDAQGRTIFWTAVVVQPACFLLLGTIVALYRRRRRGGR
jgi:ABC-type uncharacterized transport system involved in gliding motility auxiliary subunit